MIARVIDLAGTNVRGLKAIVTPPKYRHLYGGQQIPVCTLESIEYETQKGYSWLMVRFDKRGLPLPWACGFGGHRADSDNLADWVIEILGEVKP